MPVLHSYGRFIRGTGSVLFLGSGRCITGDDGNDDDGVNPPLATEDTEEGAETAASSRTSYNTTKRLKTTTSSTSPTPPSAAAVPGKITSTTGSETAVDRFKLVPAHQRTFDRNWAEGVNLQDTFRYFSGEEMARLMGFPVAAILDEDDGDAKPPRGRRSVDYVTDHYEDAGDDIIEDWTMDDGRWGENLSISTRYDCAAEMETTGEFVERYGRCKSCGSGPSFVVAFLYSLLVILTDESGLVCLPFLSFKYKL